MINQQSSLEPLLAKFKSLDKNVQYVLALAVLFLLYLGIDTFAIQPMSTQYEDLSKNIKTTITARRALEKEVQLVSKKLGIDPKLSEREQVDVLKAQIAQLDNTLKVASAQFVTAEEMIGFLNDLLLNGKNLKLIAMEKLPLEFSVLKTLESKDKSSKGKDKSSKGVDALSAEVVSEVKVYRHGVKIELSGDYIDIVKYVQAIEKMPWRIFWQSSDINAEKYPATTVIFQIYTLSLDEDWLTL